MQIMYNINCRVAYSKLLRRYCSQYMIAIVEVHINSFLGAIDHQGVNTAVE